VSTFVTTRVALSTGGTTKESSLRESSLHEDSHTDIISVAFEKPLCSVRQKTLPRRAVMTRYQGVKHQAELLG